MHKLYIKNISRKERKEIHAKNAKKIQEMSEDEISYKIIGSAIELHRQLGPGLLESVYEHTLAYNLKEIGLQIEQQVPIPLIDLLRKSN